MVQSRKETYKMVQKLFKKSRSDRGGGGRTIAPPPSEYATATITSVFCGVSKRSDKLIQLFVGAKFIH